MVSEIQDAKAKVLERIKKNINERGIDRMDIAEMETLSDIVKDLAEADYYCTVTEAMQGTHGYDGGYSQGYMPEPMGYGYPYGFPPRPMGYDGSDGRSGYRDSMGRYASRPSNMGYNGGSYGYDMQGLRDAMSAASPEEREKMQRELRQMLGM
jgi:hypothetical protein